MPEGNESKKSEVVERSTFLYMHLCALAATMKIHIKYKEHFDIRDTFKDFRYGMYELFFLNENTLEFDQKVKNVFETWDDTSVPNGVDTAYYLKSINVFKCLKAELEKRKLIVR